jgi:hypothetical protein
MSVAAEVQRICSKGELVGEVCGRLTRLLLHGKIITEGSEGVVPVVSII